MVDAIRNVVLVHGGFLDVSGWQRVCDRLSEEGYRVRVVRIPAVSLDGDVIATRQVLSEQVGRVVLVGHSYGGVVITEAGNHPSVAALVYVAAFAPDKGESVSTLLAGDLPEDVPWGIDALIGAVAAPAWRTKPTWYLVATDDQMIPVSAQRAMAERAGCVVTEVAATLVRPEAVAALVARAAEATAR